MAEVRLKAGQGSDIRQKWAGSVKPVQEIIGHQFQHLKLKERPVQVMDPITDEEIDQLKQHLKDMFPDLALDKLQKVHTSRSPSYMSWKDRHCRIRHYSFQIKKRDDPSCCLPPSQPLEGWLPDPMLDASKEHYISYTEAKLIATSEKDRPSLAKATTSQVKKSRKRVQTNVDAGEPQTKNRMLETQTRENSVADDIDLTRQDSEEAQEADGQLDVTGNEQQESGQSKAVEESAVSDSKTQYNKVLYKAQNARMSTECVECRKPRVLYSHYKLTERQQISLILCALEEHYYTCGSHCLAPDHLLFKTVLTREGLSCAVRIEMSYYTSDIGRADICAHCATMNAEVLVEMEKKI